jgi:hypothetical protein
VFNGITANVQIDNPYDGIEVENFNTMRWDSLYLVNLQDRSGNGFGMKFFRNSALGQFGDVAIITNSIIACQDTSGSYSMIGVAMDGIATLDMTHVGILQCSTGLWIENSAGNPTGAAVAFGNFNSVEIDGAHYIGLRIDAGHDLKFQGCDVWGGVRAMNIERNASLLTFSGGRIGGASEQAAVIDGSNISFNGTVFTASSNAGFKMFPMIELASHASHISFNGVRSGPNPVNGASNASYGLQIDPGADYIIVQGSDFSGNVRGGIFGNASHQAIGNNL